MPLADGPQIIDPPQYSVAWLILAALCALVIAALVIGTLRITRAVVERSAYARRPSDVETLKAEFLRAVNAVGDRVDEGEVDSREAHRELTAVMRAFVRRTTGLDVTSQDVAALRADARTREVGELVADLQEPEFALASSRDIEESLRRARGVIRAWS
ncbi:hypothetical protein [Brachybacterium nesterenkovii]|uniref:hypothetical protein n=1 Tax=Brachybacterium nesterenkovii TaxID=47847 RepID=UPI003219292C